MVISKKNLRLILLALFILLIIFYWKDLYTGIVNGMNAYDNQIK